jgi:hypothetical protein
MTAPSTLVPLRRGPITFAGIVGTILDRRDAEPSTKPKPKPRCVAMLDDGRPCGLPGRYLDFRRGGHVCLEHKPAKRQEALCL